MAGVLGWYSEGREHGENRSINQVADVAVGLLSVSLEMARDEGTTVAACWTERISSVQKASPLRHAVSVQGLSIFCQQQATWAKLQAAQVEHDRAFHLDVVGCPRFDQIRHCALHAAKLAGRLACVLLDDDPARAWERTRRVWVIADLAVFGLKLATLCGRTLADTDSGSPPRLL